MFSEMVVDSVVDAGTAAADLPQLQALLMQTRSGVEMLWDAATACINELTTYVQTEDVRAAQEEAMQLTGIYANGRQKQIKCGRRQKRP